MMSICKATTPDCMENPDTVTLGWTTDLVDLHQSALGNWIRETLDTTTNHQYAWSGA